MLVSRPYFNQGFTVFVFALMLVSCAAPPPPQVNLNSAAHQLSLQQYVSWTIKGRLGYKSSEKKQSANFRWLQTPQNFQLNLTTIIGTSILKMQGDNIGVTLEADGQTYQDTDASRLIWRVTGWKIPVEKLRQWVKGQHQKSDKVVTSEQGWVSQLQPVCKNCQNWLINYSKYKLVDDLWLPHKIVLHNSLTNSQLLIKVNEWNLRD